MENAVDRGLDWVGLLVPVRCKWDMSESRQDARIAFAVESTRIEVGLRAPLLSSTCGGGGRSRTGE